MVSSIIVSTVGTRSHWPKSFRCIGFSPSPMRPKTLAAPISPFPTGCLFFTSHHRKELLVDHSWVDSCFVLSQVVLVFDFLIFVRFYNSLWVLTWLVVAEVTSASMGLLSEELLVARTGFCMINWFVWLYVLGWFSCFRNGICLSCSFLQCMARLLYFNEYQRKTVWLITGNRSNKTEVVPTVSFRLL